MDKADEKSIEAKTEEIAEDRKEVIEAESKEEKTEREDPKNYALSGLYTDETQELVRSMQESADVMIEKYHDNPYSARDIILDIIMFFVCVAGAFGWMMLMLLIISFISLSYLHFEFDKMVIVSVLAAIVTAAVYIVMKTRKYMKLNDEKRRRIEKRRAEQLSGDPDESFLFKDKSAKKE